MKKNNKVTAVNLPQANNFDSMLKVLRILNKNKIATNNDLQIKLDWNSREVNYYLQAAQLLNLVESYQEGKVVLYKLNKETQSVFNLKERDILLYLIRKISDTYPVSKVMIDTYFKSGEFPSTKSVVKYVRKNKKDNNLSNETVMRRLSTITSWSKWIATNLRKVY